MIVYLKYVNVFIIYQIKHIIQSYDNKTYHNSFIIDINNENIKNI